MALNRNWDCIVNLKGSVAKDFLLTCKARNPATSHIFMGTLVRKRKMIQEYSD